MSDTIHRIRTTIEYFDKDGGLISSEVQEGRGLFCLTFSGLDIMTDHYTTISMAGRNVTSQDIAVALMSDEDMRDIVHDVLAILAQQALDNQAAAQKH